MSRTRLILLTALVFGVLGPPLGAICSLIIPVSWSFPNTREWLDALALLASVAQVAYFLATIPAVAAGATVASLARRFRFANDRFKLRRLFAGAAIGSLCGGLWQVTALHNTLADPFLFWKSGGFGGAVLAMFFPLHRWLVPPSNNRFERTQVTATSVSRGASQ